MEMVDGRAGSETGRVFGYFINFSHITPFTNEGLFYVEAR
jgi:hypothetical protein